MSAKLLYTEGQEQREFVCVPLMTIGRTAPNDVVIPNPRISRNHAMIRMLGPENYYLIDVGSTNGTFLNGKRVVTPELLKNGDLIAIEESVLKFLADEVQLDAPETEADSHATHTMTSFGVKVEEITLLVCDIRGYTRISEKMATNDLSALMGTWFKRATKVIEECGGTVDKFIGDAIMVRWSSENGAGAEEMVRNALRSAQRLYAVCSQINATCKQLTEPFRVGVGINTGQAVLGSIGGRGYREYTAIGDAVNMAFRFETASKELAKDVVIGKDACRYLPENLWSAALRSVTVKGKSEPVDVWAIDFGEIAAILGSAAAS